MRRIVREVIAPEYENLLLSQEPVHGAKSQLIQKGRHEVRLFTVADQYYVIKIFGYPGYVMRYVYGRLRSSKAKRSFYMAKQLLAKGIGTPEPIGYEEQYCKGALQASYYLSRYLAHEAMMYDVFTEQTHRFANYAEIMQAFATFTYQLHQQRLIHQDYTSKNILWQQHTDKLQFYLVDLNRIRQRRVSKWQRARNLAGLWNGLDVIRVLAKDYAIAAGYHQHSFVNYVLLFKQLNFFKYWLKRVRDHIKQRVRQFFGGGKNNGRYQSH